MTGSGGGGDEENDSAAGNYMQQELLELDPQHAQVRAIQQIETTLHQVRRRRRRRSSGPVFLAYRCSSWDKCSRNSGAPLAKRDSFTYSAAVYWSSARAR